MKKLITAIVTDYDLTVPQYGILRRLWQQEGLSASDLVKQTNSDSSTMMAILDRLEEKELIQKTPHSSDRRVNIILLTDQAKAFLPEMLAKVIHLEQSLIKAFSKDEIINLRSSLKKLYEAAISQRT